MDKEYDATLSDEKVFTNQTMTREFLTDIYTNLPDGLDPLNDDQFTGASRDCMTDNATSYWGYIITQKWLLIPIQQKTILYWGNGIQTSQESVNVISF